MLFKDNPADLPKELKEVFGSLTNPPKTDLQKQMEKLRELNKKIQDK
jgi:hypothetical protein